MGRKTLKSKERQQRHKEEKVQLEVARKSVDKANKLIDPLQSFTAFQKYNRNDLSVSLECKRCPHLDSETVDWILDLEERNMRLMYDTCEWGWDSKIKREEMTDPSAWYLIARNLETKPVAFSHFRFDLDYGVEVLYCYELQLESSVRRYGLGKFMLQILELIGFVNQMKKVVLTVLKHNSAAMDFFSAMNYSVDDTSPEDNAYEQYPHIILSKSKKR